MVNKYVLINSYNPAYDYWLRPYLRERKILGDREYSRKEAQDIILDMHRGGKRDHSFQKYFWTWADHPEHAPDYFHLLSMGAPD